MVFKHQYKTRQESNAKSILFYIFRVKHIGLFLTCLHVLHFRTRILTKNATWYVYISAGPSGATRRARLFGNHPLITLWCPLVPLEPFGTRNPRNSYCLAAGGGGQNRLFPPPPLVPFAGCHTSPIKIAMAIGWSSQERSKTAPRATKGRQEPTKTT